MVRHATWLAPLPEHGPPAKCVRGARRERTSRHGFASDGRLGHGRTARRTAMKSIQLLRREHEAISSVLERFERALAEAERDFAIDPETIERLLEFFERAVDGQHQEKEERFF